MSMWDVLDGVWQMLLTAPFIGALLVTALLTTKKRRVAQGRNSYGVERNTGKDPFLRRTYFWYVVVSALCLVAWWLTYRRYVRSLTAYFLHRMAMPFAYALLFGVVLLLVVKPLRKTESRHILSLSWLGTAGSLVLYLRGIAWTMPHAVWGEDELVENMDTLSFFAQVGLLIFALLVVPWRLSRKVPETPTTNCYGCTPTSDPVYRECIWQCVAYSIVGVVLSFVYFQAHFSTMDMGLVEGMSSDGREFAKMLVYLLVIIWSLGSVGFLYTMSVGRKSAESSVSGYVWLCSFVCLIVLATPIILIL